MEMRGMRHSAATFGALSNFTPVSGRARGERGGGISGARVTTVTTLALLFFAFADWALLFKFIFKEMKAGGALLVGYLGVSAFMYVFGCC